MKDDGRLRRMTVAVIAMMTAGAVLSVAPATVAVAARATADRPGFHGSICVEASRRAMHWGVRHAVREWNSAPVGPRLVLRERCSGAGTRVRIDAARIPGKGTGVTRRRDDGSFHVIFNTGSLWQYPTDRWCVKGHTATHELGHVLGLPHFPSRGDMVMGYGNWWVHCGDLRPADRRLKHRHLRSAASRG